MNKILGPALIPNKKVYRGPNKTNPEGYYIYFTAETIAKSRTKFHQNNFDNKVNINHDGILIEGIILSDSFLIDDQNRKDIPSEFKDLPNGTWMVEYEIHDKELWKRVNSSELNGFSIEGIFNLVKSDL